MDYIFTSGKSSVRKRYARRGSLPAESVSTVDLTDLGGHNNNLGSVGSEECILSPTPDSPPKVYQRLSRLFCMYWL